MKHEVFVDLAQKKYWRQLVDFFNNPVEKSGFCYIRGRRRIGKTTLLKAYQKKYPLSRSYPGKLRH